MAGTYVPYMSNLGKANVTLLNLRNAYVALRGLGPFYLIPVHVCSEIFVYTFSFTEFPFSHHPGVVYYDPHIEVPVVL